MRGEARRGLGLLLVGALALPGCGAGGAGDGGLDGGAPAWPDGTLTLGGEGADGGFVTLTGQVEGAPGSQGGYHVPLRYQVSGAAAPGVVFQHRVTRAVDGALVSKGERTWDVGPASPWTSERPTIVFLCPTPVGVNVVAEPLVFVVTATRDGQLLGAARATATFGCPPGDAFCERICSGD